MQRACQGRRIPTARGLSHRSCCFPRKHDRCAAGCRCACLHGNFGVAATGGNLSCTTRAYESCKRVVQPCTTRSPSWLVVSVRCSSDTFDIALDRRGGAIERSAKPARELGSENVVVWLG